VPNFIILAAMIAALTGLIFAVVHPVIALVGLVVQALVRVPSRLLRVNTP
jgi:hypothetical protein